MDRRLNSTKQYTVNLQFLWRHWPLLKDCDMKIHKCVKSFQCGVFNAQYKLIYLVVGNRKLYIDSWFQCGRVRLTCFCWLVIFRRRFVAKTYPGIFLETLLQVVLEFAAVDLINVRARAMQNASNNVSSGMMTVFLRSSSKLGDALEAAKLYVPPALGFLFLLSTLSTDSRKFKCM